MTGKNYIKKGYNPWSKGKYLTEEHKRKIGLALKGHNCYKNTERSRKLREINLGKKASEESRLKMSLSHKGKPPWNKGKKFPQLRGENNYNWKGGLTLKSKLLRNSKEWKEWRLKVFSRDNYTCQHCNQRGIILHPHHIISMAECIKLNKKEEIFNVNNGLTLCYDCHLRKGLHRGID